MNLRTMTIFSIYKISSDEAYNIKQERKKLFSKNTINTKLFIFNTHAITLIIFSRGAKRIINTLRYYPNSVIDMEIGCFYRKSHQTTELSH